MAEGRVQHLLERHWRGVLVVALVAGTAQFLSEHYGAPAMLMALLIGMALHFLAVEEPTQPGIDFATRGLLRTGVALLGLRIGVGDIAALGPALVFEIMVLVVATIIAGMAAARLIGRSWHYGALTGGAVAICGASAALAISAVLPRGRISEKDTLLTVVAVTTLSTLAMVFYPVLFSALGLDERQTGFLIGATIHDVAQVVGAGYSVGEGAGDTATVVKLLRVAMLPAVLVVFTAMAREGKGARIALPWFLVAFIALVMLNNFATLPEWLTKAAETLSRACLLLAVAGLGIKTSIGELRAVGRGKLGIIVAETLFLLCAAVGLLMLTRSGAV